MTGNKIFGSILLALGLLIILWGLYSSYNIFKAKSALPQVFSSEEIASQEAINTNKTNTKKLTAEEIQENMQDAVNQQLSKIFPPGIILKLLNIISWSMFAWILILGGGKIAYLGVRMLK